MLHRSNSPPMHSRPRSNSHPVRPPRFRRPSDINEGAPVRPPRNPARPPSTLVQELLGPLPLIPSNSTTASQHDFWEGEIENERHRPSVDAPKSLVKRMQDAENVPLPQINTLDRKILRELKQSMLARSAQFALKNNTKHHPFPSDEVPYPRSYDHKCLDTDVWETVFCEQYCGDITFHTFDVPPTKVLDIGCGSGAWIMACARRWKNCQFVGLDIVPLHPDLGRSELGQRVSWVQNNFLEPLPFPNEEFDFVHIKRIARGVPEHKWDALFEEVTRVMKPGAVLEMLEEDLYIPGQVMASAENGSISPASPSSSSPEEHSQLYAPSMPRPSPSLPDISAAYSGVQTVRRSISERHKTQPTAIQATSNTSPPPLPPLSIPSNPDHSRVFPRPRPSKSPRSRPIASHFNFQNLLSKRSGREHSPATDGEQPRKPKKESLISKSLFDLRRPSTPSEKPHISKPYISTSGASSNLTLRSNRTVHAPPIPPQGLRRFSEVDPILPSPTVESPSCESEVDFTQSDESGQSFSQLFSYPTAEDDIKWKPPPNILSSLNSGLFHEVDPIEAEQWEGELNLFPPVPLPKDIPGRLTPLTISLSPSSSEVSSSMTGLSLSGPESRFTDHSDHYEDQLLTPPPSDTSGSTKHLSITSLAVSTAATTGQEPAQSSRWSEDSGVDGRPSISTNPEAPPNPRQHKLLDVIYREMHAARCVNLAPISLIDGRIRMHFTNVRTREPLIFVFPPPPGCQHRPEPDAAELRQRKLSQQRMAECGDGQDRYSGHETHPANLSPLISAFPPPPGCENRPEFDSTPPSSRSMTPSPQVSRPNSLKPVSQHPARERSSSVTSNGPVPSRARSSSVRSAHSFTTDPEAANRRQPCLKGSRSTIGLSDQAMSDRVLVMGEGLIIGKREHAMMETSARVASDERQRSRQRSGSLGKGGTGEARPRLPASALTLTRPSAGPLPPPSAFMYKDPNVTPFPPFITTPPSPTTSRRDSGRGKLSLAVVDKPRLNTLSNKKTESARSLSLHLRVRVVEILGCSEVMWDWVREYQTRELEKERKHKEKLAQAAKTKGVGGGRVAYYHGRSGGRDRKDSGQPALTSKPSREHLTQAYKTNKESKPPASKTSKEPLSPAAKASGEQPAPAPKRVRRAGGGRVSYFQQPARKPVARERANSGSTDHSTLNAQRSTRTYSASAKSKGTPSLYSTTSSGSGRTEDPYGRIEKSVRQELLHMTRERFNEILLWFQFDMDDSIRLTRSMTMRAQCAPFSTEPSEQRKAFDEACEKLESHLLLHPKPPASLVEYGGYGPSSPVTRKSQRGEEVLCCMPTLLGRVHPSKRLCRTIRVWIAVKP